MKLRLLPLALAGLAIAAVGCSRGDDDGPAAQAAPAAASVPASTKPTAAAAPAASAAFAAKVGESALGKILAGTDGLTLYGFVNVPPTPSRPATARAPRRGRRSSSARSGRSGPASTPASSSTARRWHPATGRRQVPAVRLRRRRLRRATSPARAPVTWWFAVALDGTLITDAGAPAEAGAPTTPPPAPGARPGRANRSRRRAGRRGRADAVRVHQGRRRAPDLRR